jgi:hypothetical protein
MFHTPEIRHTNSNIFEHLLYVQNAFLAVGFYETVFQPFTYKVIKLCVCVCVCVCVREREKGKRIMYEL